MNETAMAKQISIARIPAPYGAAQPIWNALRELSCRTGNAGDPMPARRWPLFVRIWVEPYQLLLPQWSYVALADGLVVGYLTGCPDSASFARRRWLRCTLPLAARIAFGGFRDDDSRWRYLRQALGLERSAEHAFPRRLRSRLNQEFPAHLHINVDAGYRRGGIGQRLIAQFLSDLRQQRIAGMHLYCGAEPLPFYRRMGFAELAVVSVRGHDVYAMGLSL